MAATVLAITALVVALLFAQRQLQPQKDRFLKANPSGSLSASASRQSGMHLLNFPHLMVFTYCFFQKKD